MNTKNAQIFTPVTMIFMVIAFIIVWALFGAKFLNDSIAQAINTGYYSGIEAFLLTNLNLIIYFALLVAIIALGVYSARQ
jgi:cation transport ATPase